MKLLTNYWLIDLFVRCFCIRMIVSVVGIWNENIHELRKMHVIMQRWNNKHLVTWKILCSSILTIASAYCFPDSVFASSLVSIPSNITTIRIIVASFWIPDPGTTTIPANRQLWCGHLAFIFITKGHFSYIRTISDAWLCELITGCYLSDDLKNKQYIIKNKNLEMYLSLRTKIKINKCWKHKYSTFSCSIRRCRGCRKRCQCGRRCNYS